jgi:RimJ/RimL family protein N-acetyltransferase
VTGSDPADVTTARLVIRPPREADRDRLVKLFCDERFMVFSPGVLTQEQAHDKFDHMVAVCKTVPFGKQPVVELSSGLVVGYAGVDYIDFEGKTWLEWGYRLVPECRGLGYATEALLAKAHQTYAGELLAIIALENLASQNVCHKLGSPSGSRQQWRATSATSTPSLSENAPAGQAG